eukprot:395190-Ditylum_brightwellii.AAC.1
MNTNCHNKKAFTLPLVPIGTNNGIEQNDDEVNYMTEDDGIPKIKNSTDIDKCAKCGKPQRVMGYKEGCRSYWARSIVRLRIYGTKILESRQSEQTYLDQWISIISTGGRPSFR